MKLCVTVCVSFVSSSCEVVTLCVCDLSVAVVKLCHYVCVICE